MKTKGGVLILEQRMKRTDGAYSLLHALGGRGLVTVMEAIRDGHQGFKHFVEVKVP